MFRTRPRGVRPRFVPFSAFLLVLAALAPATPAVAQHDAGAMAMGKARPPVQLYDGMGSLHFPISTKNPRAQRFMDQGMTLHYGFNDEEAIRSFEEVARLDPKCAMAWWGIALAHGPNINLPMDSPGGKAAWSAMQTAKALAPFADAREKAYIAALATRYEAEPGQARGRLDSAYVDAMRGLAQAHPDDVDASVLYAEALMNLRPWDHWTKDGRMQPGTELLLPVLEGVLARAPDHVGANHYYIHSVEASPDPGKATPCAERLRTLVPAAGHLVHMPAHIWMRTGRYDDASAANQQAATADSLYILRTGADGVYTMMYYPHNVHFLWASLTLAGRRAEALAAARRAASLVPADVARAMPMAEFIPPTPYYALVRFGDWDAMIAEPAPPTDLRFVKGMWHYARGVALAMKGRAAEARVDSDSLEAIAAATDPAFLVDINSAKALLETASEVLTARLAGAAGRGDEAIRHLERAVTLEDGLRYAEPPAWYQPVRQLLGQAYLDAGRPADAERVLREDLVHYPENGWALSGLARACEAQGKAAEAKDAADRFARAWARADVKLTATRF